MEFTGTVTNEVWSSQPGFGIRRRGTLGLGEAVTALRSGGGAGSFFVLWSSGITGTETNEITGEQTKEFAGAHANALRSRLFPWY